MLTYEAHARADPAVACAPLPLETALALSYGPLVDLLVRNLARAAERAG